MHSKAPRINKLTPLLKLHKAKLGMSNVLPFYVLAPLTYFRNEETIK